MINVKTVEQTRGWKQIILQGFSALPEKSLIFANFKLVETEESATYIFKNPINIQEYNAMLSAMKIPAVQDGSEISLPELGEDLNGMDAPILGNIVPNGKYLNVRGFKSADGTVAESPFG